MNMDIKTYLKGDRNQLSENFKSTEFDCHGDGCCSMTKVDMDLVKILQKIRTHFGVATNINSGYRCPTHNKAVGGASQSYHMKGQAADISIRNVAPSEVAKYAESIGVLGIGLYDTFVHVDTRTSKFFWKTAKEIPVSTFGGTPIKEDTSNEGVVKELEKAKEAINKALEYLK